eukprot:SAG31_NODE_2382_length_5827_cov_1.421962_8_plen_64_part_00
MNTADHTIIPPLHSILHSYLSSRESMTKRQLTPEFFHNDVLLTSATVPPLSHDEADSDFRFLP